MYKHGTKMYGTFRCSGAMLKDVGRIRAFMLDLVSSIGMTELGTHIYDVPTAIKRLGQTPLHDEGGVTAVTILSTSHAALHTWPEDGGARFDVDSCREFDPAVVLEVIQRAFEATEVTWEAAAY